MIRDPGFRDFLSSEARYQRGEGARHNNFNSIGQVFLNNYPVGSAGMRMFFCHKPYMVFDCRNAKNTLGAVRAAKAAKCFCLIAVNPVKLTFAAAAFPPLGVKAVKPETSNFS